MCVGSIQYGVLKHFASWEHISSVCIEKFFDKNCLIFWSKNLNQFSIKIMHKDLI